MDNTFSLAKSELVATDSAKANTWSNLQEQAYGFVKEHSTELIVAGALAATGAGLWRLGKGALATRGSAELAGAGAAELTGAATESKLSALAARGAAATTERAELSTLPNTILTESKALNRSGAELLATFKGDGPKLGSHFADTMKSMQGLEIPRFAEEYASQHPDAAAKNLVFILDRAPMTPGTEKLWKNALENISQGPGLRTGEKLATEFMGDGPMVGSHYAQTMQSMKSAEIPRFTREYAFRVPESAAHNVHFILDRAAMPAETESVWAKALSDMRK